MTNDSSQFIGEENRNSRFFANARRNQGRAPNSMDVRADGTAVNPFVNPFDKLDAARAASKTKTREDRMTNDNPRGLIGGEYAAPAFRGRAPRRRIAGVTREHAEGVMQRYRRKNDGFFADADRTRHMDPSRPHRTEKQYVANQADLRNVDPKTVEQDDPVIQGRNMARDAAPKAQASPPEAPAKPVETPFDQYSPEQKQKLYEQGAETADKWNKAHKQ